MGIDDTKPTDSVSVSEIPEYIRDTRTMINTIASRAGVLTTAAPTTAPPTTTAPTT